MNRYWFARQFPLSEPEATRMSPVSSEGWAVVALVAGCLVAGLVGLLLYSFAYRAPFLGLTLFVGFGVAGVLGLLIAIRLKGDRAHTVEDYRTGRAGARPN